MSEYRESGVLRAINTAGEAVLMNLTFLVCSVPVVTGGQAWSGLYAAIRAKANGESWFSGFKSGFCRHFLRGLLGWTVSLALAAYLALTVYTIVFYREPGFIPPLVISGLLLLLTLSWQAGAVAGPAFLEQKTGDWLQTPIRLVFRAPHRLLALVILTWLPVGLFWFWPDLLFHTVLIFLAAYFALTALLGTLLLRPVLRLYDTEENGESQ